MGLFQMACLTYDHFENRAGVLYEGEKEPLAPVSHIIQNAQIEITINQDGSFVAAKEVEKEDEITIIPATIGSASRTSKFVPHPLCEQLKHIWSIENADCQEYLAQLRSWVESPYSHEKAKAVLEYVTNNSIVSDLTASGLLPENASSDQKNGNRLIRWRIVPASESACWKDVTLFNSYIDYYSHQTEGTEKRFCQVSGEMAMCTDAHPKGTVKMSFGAKLISANDSSGFTFRGRFTEKEQAGSVSYLASQKAHNALRWLVVNRGVVVDGRAFLCWSPQGRDIPESKSILFDFMPRINDEKCSEASYRERLRDTLLGYRQGLKPDDRVVIVAFDSATTGRLSVVYYNEQTASDFLDHTESWFQQCCWPLYGSVVSPSIDRVAKVAFGTERSERLGVADSLKKSLVQRLFSCVVQEQRIPEDIVRAASNRASQPQSFKNLNNREVVISTACAIIRKSRMETRSEEWDMSLDESIQDRSYLFGRLLAVAEKVEKDTYDAGERRETNAIRLQSVFSQRPLYTWRILEERLIPYYGKLARRKPGLLSYYKQIIEEIWEKMPADDSNLNHALEDVYLIGYYNQRAAFYKKRETAETEDTTTK